MNESRARVCATCRLPWQEVGAMRCRCTASQGAEARRTCASSFRMPDIQQKRSTKHTSTDQNQRDATKPAERSSSRVIVAPLVCARRERERKRARETRPPTSTNFVTFFSLHQKECCVRHLSDNTIGGCCRVEGNSSTIYSGGDRRMAYRGPCPEPVIRRHRRVELAHRVERAQLPPS